MAKPIDTFDLNDFARILAELPYDQRTNAIARELDRMRPMFIRDANTRFQQQKYVKALERLARGLKGEDVSQELMPSDRQAFVIVMGATVLAPDPEPEVEPVSPPVSPPAPPAMDPPAMPAMAAVAAAPAPEVEKTGKERRTSRRIQMKTKARIRREADNVAEIVEPVNVSRGGLGFESPKRFALHEIVWVIMHYGAGSGDALGEMETRSQIVRAAAMNERVEHSYGVKFLT